MDPEQIKKGFPPGIQFPAALRELCIWHDLAPSWKTKSFYDFPPYLRKLFRLPQEGVNKRISGYFRLTPDSYEFIKHWFGTDDVSDRFAVFGTGHDGSIYAIWKQDDARCPIVHLGSEGQNNFVLAGNMVDFLRLLAIGYEEIGFSDLSRPPSAEQINEPFRAWVTRAFHVTIPQTGIEIAAPAQASHQNFQDWIENVMNKPL